MEAVPKLPLISFELKVSPETTHFGPKLKQVSDLILFVTIISWWFLC